MPGHASDEPPSPREPHPPESPGIPACQGQNFDVTYMPAPACPDCRHAGRWGSAGLGARVQDDECPDDPGQPKQLPSQRQSRGFPSVTMRAQLRHGTEHDCQHRTDPACPTSARTRYAIASPSCSGGRRSSRSIWSLPLNVWTLLAGYVPNPLAEHHASIFPRSFVKAGGTIGVVPSLSNETG